MRKYGIVLGIMGLGLYGFPFSPLCAHSLSESRNRLQEPHEVLVSKENHHDISGLSTYHKTPRLYPAKKKLQNPLRERGWHTHPDPYIEEGGVYTHEEHPALTDTQAAMRDYTTGDPNHYVTPPSTVTNMPRVSEGQQRVRITDPFPGKAPPITLPPS